MKMRLAAVLLHLASAISCAAQSAPNGAGEHACQLVAPHPLVEGNQEGLLTELARHDAAKHALLPRWRPNVDELLKRPYDASVPFGGSGARLWATSPQGFGFNDGVHFIYINNFVPFKLKIPGFKPGKATYYPSHVHTEGEPGALVEASASFTYTIDGVDRPLTKPFVKEKRWTCWNSKNREDWYVVDFGQNVQLNGVTLYFFDDAPNGGCRPPEKLQLEYWTGQAWEPVESLINGWNGFSPGANQLAFNKITTTQLKFKFKNRGENYYTGLYGVDPEYAVEPKINVEQSVKVSTDKYITDSDAVVTSVQFTNTGSSAKTIRAMWEHPWESTSNPEAVDAFSTISSVLESFRATTFIDKRNVHIEFLADVRSSKTNYQDRIRKTPQETFEYLLEPNEIVTLRLAAVPWMDDPDQSQWAGVFPLHELYSSYATDWFDSNLATFDCSDPYVTKQFWHRAYVLKKNFMNPKLGKLEDYCCSEGRWKSDWYHHVISYGAGHQIREARWFADPRYSWGQLQTFCKNPRPDGIFPSHITPEGQKGGQYTDWISSTALDVMAVHPNTELLTKNLPALAKNAKAWIDVYDKDNDFLPVVDSHWWTGMEWQPSFFYFYNFLPKKGEDDLERVDLAAYAYGDAKNVAECARLLGKSDDAKSLDELASKIKNAVETKLWNKEWQYFLSNRFEDDKPALVKEEIGVYPYYFGLPTPGKGYEAAWKSIIDPAEMWGPWPVRSCSLKCAAYSPGVFWPIGENVATGCMWNGPTWPHANSIIMTAMARTLRDYPECDLKKKHLFELFNSFTKAQFKNGDINNPWTGEYYHAETGEWLTNEHDYNHSTYLDILIPDLCGLRPRNDNILEIDPLLPDVKEGGWSHFLLDGQYYRGHFITIIWDAPDGKRPYGTTIKGGVEFFEGLTVFVDGKLAGRRANLGKLQIELK